MKKTFVIRRGNTVDIQLSIQNAAGEAVDMRNQTLTFTLRKAFALFNSTPIINESFSGDDWEQAGSFARTRFRLSHQDSGNLMRFHGYLKLTIDTADGKRYSTDEYLVIISDSKKNEFDGKLEFQDNLFAVLEDNIALPFSGANAGDYPYTFPIIW